MTIQRLLSAFWLLSIPFQMIAQQHSLAEGFFTPHTQEANTLYLYDISNGKVGTQPRVVDSITFEMRNGHASAIRYAPQDFSPFEQKLDNGILLLKVVKLGVDYHEVMLNEDTNKTAFVSTWSGTFSKWGQFFLNCQSIEFLEANQKIFDHPKVRSAGRTVATPYFKVRYVQGEWMEVILLNVSYESTGEKTWIRWRANGKLLINYNLFA